VIPYPFLLPRDGRVGQGEGDGEDQAATEALLRSYPSPVAERGLSLFADPRVRHHSLWGFSHAALRFEIIGVSSGALLGTLWHAIVAHLEHGPGPVFQPFPRGVCQCQGKAEVWTACLWGDGSEALTWGFRFRRPTGPCSLLHCTTSPSEVASLICGVLEHTTARSL
jgi:hypothetical protein